MYCYGSIETVILIPEHWNGIMAMGMSRRNMGTISRGRYRGDGSMEMVAWGWEHGMRAWGRQR